VHIHSILPSLQDSQPPQIIFKQADFIVSENIDSHSSLKLISESIPSTLTQSQAKTAGCSKIQGAIHDELPPQINFQYDVFTDSQIVDTSAYSCLISVSNLRLDQTTLPNSCQYAQLLKQHAIPKSSQHAQLLRPFPIQNSCQHAQLLRRLLSSNSNSAAHGRTLSSRLDGTSITFTSNSKFLSTCPAAETTSIFQFQFAGLSLLLQKLPPEFQTLVIVHGGSVRIPPYFCTIPTIFQIDLLDLRT
jgi:hypothetical protein